MAAFCRADSLEEWEYVKSVAAISRQHKVRITLRNGQRKANLQHTPRQAAKLDQKNKKLKKPRNLGQGPKGTRLFTLLGDWYDWHDGWYDAADDWYKRCHGFFSSEDGPIGGGGVSQPILQNAWIMFGELSGGTLPTQQGLTNRTCSICCEDSIRLVADLGCKHVACEHCWHWWVAQFPQGPLVPAWWNWNPYRNQPEWIGTIPCFMPGCPSRVGIPARVRASIAAGKCKEPASVCALCCETKEPLLQNSGCSCTACAACWRRWVNTKLGECRMTRKLDRVPCFTPGCSEAICETLLRRSCATSVRGSDLIRDLCVRRRLQNNTLYPAESQVDCPRPGCLGLGYLGFDQVMCYICEHQWASNGCGPSDSVPSEVKKCPKCGVQIAKDGGCNHMTCNQCNHEFWWTSLAPYHE